MRETISVYTEPYTKFVIRGLIKIKGRSESDVANFVLKEWISDHRDEIAEYGLTVGRAREMKVLK